MEWSLKYFLDWKTARTSRAMPSNINIQACQPTSRRWKPLKTGTYKLNTDAAFKTEATSFSIGLVLHDHLGSFIVGMVKKARMVSSVFEAEATAISEGLQWLSALPYQHVELESDSLLSVQALSRSNDNYLEVGFVLDKCRVILKSRPGVCSNVGADSVTCYDVGADSLRSSIRGVDSLRCSAAKIICLQRG
ncbi:hypothetical protein POM88_022519 [Heracleum sosnowskyi]|uniref:RNase H type-1 domain-containing protein n=1 Tax=Heracleum sosnowskyi TaxID=360622 RepID=A0AAD8MTR0_9APIA|nr:hypothetical protein POM88_022519 [Heracleum sosnowskyi]